jgi:hypothetical protein
LTVTRYDEPDYLVHLTIRLTTTVRFARSAPYMSPKGTAPDDADVITLSDAIDNAIGQLPEDVFDGFGGEFDIALPIDGEATLLYADQYE